MTLDENALEPCGGRVTLIGRTSMVRRLMAERVDVHEEKSVVAAPDFTDAAGASDVRVDVVVYFLKPPP